MPSNAPMVWIASSARSPMARRSPWPRLRPGWSAPASTTTWPGSNRRPPVAPPTSMGPRAAARPAAVGMAEPARPARRADGPAASVPRRAGRRGPTTVPRRLAAAGSRSASGRLAPAGGVIAAYREHQGIGGQHPLGGCPPTRSRRQGAWVTAGAAFRDIAIAPSTHARQTTGPTGADRPGARPGGTLSSADCVPPVPPPTGRCRDRVHVCGAPRAAAGQ
jgi:hypothetical protein